MFLFFLAKSYLGVELLGHILSIYLIIRNYQTLLQSGCTIFHSHQQCMRVPAVLFPFQHLVMSVLSDFIHSNNV